MRRQNALTVTDEGQAARRLPGRQALLSATGLGAALAFGLVALSWSASQPVIPDAASSRLDVRVVDGDTIEDRTSGIRYRIENIDTPETGARAQCDAERDLGDRATEAVRQLFARAEHVEIRPLLRKDRHGRTIARVDIDGKDLGAILIAENLARPWRGHREPWCSRDGALLR